ncbi:PaaI family thioesterase [Sphingomonas sp. CLY1604]|uniref:PaaI family thioesterase n=1 Tax=Sphingomonas sp. CLY1604 TaxID=3457786 RepID=UPI003FD7B85A
MSGFNIDAFMAHRFGGHGGTLGIVYHDKGDGWVELGLPYSDALVGDPASGVIASGPIIALMDMATSVAVWMKRDRFAPQATLDLRVDYLRPAVPGRTVIGRGECLKLTRSIAFVRGIAYDATPDDPLAHVAGTFMLMDQMA